MPTAKKSAQSVVAAIDLGSNSFHMIVARLVNGRLYVIDRLRDMVQLGAGLNERNRLSAEAQQRALICLKRFGERVRDMPPGSVRCVGTNTLRQARNAGDFLARAERALGHPIEVIAGREEARLVYLGVAHSVSGEGRKRLVMDIGGGSTELIIGRGFEALEMESLFMGCVSMSRAHFADGRITARAMDAAELAALQELQPVREQLRHGWKTAIGASGTIIATADVIRAMGWRKFGITLPALEKLRRTLISAGNTGKLKLSGLSPRRAAMFPGGVAILIAAFKALGIKNMRVSDGALREGLLYDMVGRIRHEDMRERTVVALSRHYHIDTEQAGHVAKSARTLLGAVAKDWQLDPARHGALLGWAARLHEVGLSIAHTRYHKHGAYLLEHSDLPGFSRQDQRLLATLVRGHRRKFPVSVFNALPASQRTVAGRLCILLRLAALLQRARRDPRLPRLYMKGGATTLSLRFPPGWLSRHPLTAADLQDEAVFLKAARVKLKFS
jgi:exopolyphosphatase/guanosine-5'-triphosphate,3'-diphosphate pyrophosphatase